MHILTSLTRVAAYLIRFRFRKWTKKTVELQEKTFRQLVKKGRKTAFGKDHDFENIVDYESFKKRVPIRDYEGIKPYIDRIWEGEKDVLWKGLPKYFALSSGTTSGTKRIPVTDDSISNHIDSARNALLMYINKTGNHKFVKGKYLFLSGSPELDTQGIIPAGRLSGIAHQNVPGFLQPRRLPSYKTNCIAEWEKKLQKIIEETLTQNMTLISGITPWLQMYFEKLLEYTDKKNVLEVFPEFSLMVHGGVNFEPYEKKIFHLIGGKIDTLETYPASEGFIAFQDEFPSQGLLLIPDSGIFYEFIPADRFYDENPPRIPLSMVEKNTNYVIILNSNAGLWGYNLGDTVKFTSIRPYRIVVTGRISQFTSAFGEHVIEEEADYAIQKAAEKTRSLVTEFTMAPLINNPNGRRCHQWFIEFEKEPENIDEFTQILDNALKEKNQYYANLLSGNIVQPANVIKVPEGTFNKYMQAIGKLGGQNKVPHLSNDRKIADWILQEVDMNAEG